MSKIYARVLRDGLLILLWLASSASSVFCGEGDAFYLCKRLSIPPHIDGFIKPNEWAGTELGGPLTTSTTGKDAPVTTSFRLGYDRSNLYFAAICQEPEMNRIRASVRLRDGDVYSDDCVELCLDTAHEHTTMTKFIVNSLGTICEFRHGNTEWDGDVEVAAASMHDAWTVEMRIPFAELGISPKIGDVWGLNVFRTRYVKDTELFNWFNANGVFTLPVRLGHIVFDGPGVSIPDMAAAHPKLQFELEPELAALGDSFEGRAWTFADNELAQDHSLHTSILTPHLRMSGPLANGPIKALAFLKVPGTGRDAMVGTRARDLVELGCRFDIQPTAVFVNEQGICGGVLGERRLRALLQNRYDVFMFIGVPPSVLPPWQLAEIKAKIRRGAGALLVYEGRDFLSTNGEKINVPEVLKTAVPVTDISGYDTLVKSGITGFADGRNPLLNCFILGKGRAALIAYPDAPHSLTRFVPLDDKNLTEYDYWLGLAGFTAVWCSGREAELVVKLPNGCVFERSSLPKNCRVMITAAEGKTLGSLKVDAYIRGYFRNRTKILSRSLDGGTKREAEVILEIPTLPYGRYFLELQLLRGSSVVGFGVETFEVCGPQVLKSLVLNSDYVEKDGVISGTFTLSDLGNAENIGCNIELVTRDGRVLSRQPRKSVNASEQMHKFSFAIPEDATISMEVRVTLHDDRGAIASLSAPFFVPNRRRDVFGGVVWDAPDEPMGIYAYESIRSAGFNISLNGTATPVTDWTDFSALPYTTRLTNARDSDGVTVGGCWEDPQAVQNRIDAAIRKQKDNWKRGVFAYSLGDENDTLGCCLHPACMEAYRAYLKEQYRTIEALNESWGENYKSFEEVSLLEDDDFFTHSKAYRSGKYARWFDRYRFAQKSYARLCGKFASAFSSLDPHAITGFEGAGSFGDDIDAILDNVGMWATYNNVIDDIIRTLDRPAILRGSWMGYTKDADTLAAFAWRSICLGANSLWWWRWDGIGQYRGLVRPTLDLWPATRVLAEEMKSVFEGLGQLLSKAKLESDGVAVLYSVDSAVAENLPFELPFGRGAVAHSAFIHMFKDSGIQYRYVTPRDIASGALSGYNVLVLPRCVSLNRQTAGEIRKFVEYGGTLIADLRPAVMDDHAKQLDSGLLDDVFGVRRKGPGRAKRFKGPINVTIAGRNISISMLRGTADADYTIAGGKVGAAIEDVPIFIENKYGRGRTLLINSCLDYFESIRESHTATEIREPILAVCEQAGVRAPVTISSESGGPLSMTELTRWSIDGGKIISLRTDRYGWGWAAVGPGPAEEKRAVVVTLPEPKFVYDLRNHRCLGHLSAFKTTLKTGYANFYGLFDQPLAKPTINCTTKNVQDGKRLEAIVRTSVSQTAVVLNLIDDEGNRPEWARKVIVVKNGEGHASWRLPLNGSDRWVVEARELFTRIGIRR